MLTGKEEDLKAALISTITAAIQAKSGSAPLSPNCIDGLAAGIANAIIPFLVANIQVNTSVVIPVTSAPGTPSAGTGTGGIS